MHRTPDRNRNQLQPPSHEIARCVAEFDISRSLCHCAQNVLAMKAMVRIARSGVHEQHSSNANGAGSAWQPARAGRALRIHITESCMTSSSRLSALISTILLFTYLPMATPLSQQVRFGSHRSAMAGTLEPADSLATPVSRPLKNSFNMPASAGPRMARRNHAR
jgi:hypothetical protein